MQGKAVEELQRELNASGASLPVDGKYGAATEAAVRDFQRRHGLAVDGKAGATTLVALYNDGQGGDIYAGKTLTALPGGALPATAPPGAGVSNPTSPLSTRLGNNPPIANAPTAANGQPPNKTASFDTYVKRGRRNQMVKGRITINGSTYNFRSGGSGKGNLPAGDYKITAHLWSRRDASMSVGGVGYSFAMSDKYDPRVGATRTLLRIHPDGRGPGTLGCVGIVGDASVQRRFRDDMRAELNRNGGSFDLRVG
jgi:hypothetical protein